MDREKKRSKNSSYEIRKIYNGYDIKNLNRKLTCVIDLPVLRADDEHSALIVRAALHADGVQASNLLALVLVDRLRVLVLVAVEGPNFYSASSRERQNYVILPR